MKAIVHHRYGSPDVLRLEEVEKPDVPEDGVLVRVRAASVNALDWHRMRGQPFPVRLGEGLRRPKSGTLGADVAGEVEAVGSGVTDLAPGDTVFGVRTGGFAEYVAGRTFVRMPAGLSFEQAAAIPVAGLTALQGLRDKGGLQAGQRVLVNGASGGVGTFAVQIAKALGAYVTGVTSTGNLELVRSLGADEVIDYTRQDFTAGGQRYDLILDIAGSRPLLRCRRLLTQEGRLVVVGGPGGRVIRPLERSVAAALISRLTGQRLLPFLSQPSRDDLVVLRELVEAGRVTPVIDRTYALSDVPAAIRYVEAGHARGKVVITV